MAKRYPNKSKKQFKKRYEKKSLLFKNKYNTYNKITYSVYIYPEKNLILSRSYISFFRKYFRKFLKKKKTKLFFKLQLNYNISVKNKNSRMGKGVGSIKRRSFFLEKRKPFILIKNCNYSRVKLICLFLRKRQNINFNFIKL